jgi:hypothetical protein
MMEGILAARTLQNWYRRLRILRKIDTLRQRLLRKLDTERSLSSSDFLLLFSYAVYSGLCDICFGYFDCHRYEDGETYLVPDVSIKCDDSVYLDAKNYAIFTSLLFPLGIPVCYMVALVLNYGVICPRLESILKDKDYATAFALASKRSCFVDDQKTAWKIQIAKGATKHAGRVGVLTVRHGTVNQERFRKFSQQRKQGVLWWMWAGQAEKGVPLMDCINVHGNGNVHGNDSFCRKLTEEVRLHEATAKYWQGFAVKKDLLTAHVPRKDLLVHLRMGNVPKLAGDELMKAKQEAVDEWTRDNPEMARFLSGKDYKSQFESLRARAGYQKAKHFIQHKARDASLIAHRYKFLWGPYDVGRWYFEVLDMIRRFLVIGLPQVLRAVAPNAGIQIYLGLLVLSVSPVAYSAMDPYKDRNEQRLMIFTQLASTVVVLCGMVYDKIGPGSVSNWIVTVIILVTLCPMLLVLLFFVFYPNGRDRRLLFKRWSDRMPAYCSRRAHAVMDAWNDLQGVLRRIGQENEQVGNAVDAAIASIKDGDMEEDDVKDVMRLCGKIVAAASICNVETVQECTRELLGLFGVNSTQANAVVTSVGARLLIWCLKPKLELQLRKTGLEWADVVPVLETIDSVEELKDAMADPMDKLTKMAEASVPLAKKLAIMRLKPELEPQLRKTGLEWADVVPALETIDSVEELKDAMAEPAAFLARLAEASVLG